MTIKELEAEIKQLKQQLREQNNKWNKIIAYASIVTAMVAVLNLLIAWLNYCKNSR